MIPFYCAASGYGFLWNLPSFGSVTLSANNGQIAWYSQSAPQIDFWVTTVPDAANWKKVCRCAYIMSPLE